MQQYIIRGTTPTIEYTFSCVDVADIVAAYLTIRQHGVVLIEQDLSQATVGETSLSYLLSQTDTLLLQEGPAEIMHNFVLLDGTRGASDEMVVEITRNHINRVITPN